MAATIAFLTDFGSKDWYVAAMKGVVLSLAGSNPLHILDIGHDVPQGDTGAAGFILNEVYDSLPHGGVVVAVIDPTVGSDRGIAVIKDETTGRVLVGPHNGLFNMVCRLRQAVHFTLTRFDTQAARQLLSPFAALGDSNTFHGRDIFAPLGALIALGKIRPYPIGNGETGPYPVEQAPEILTPAAVKPGRLLQVVYYDGFGNLFLNVRPAPQIGELRFKLKGADHGYIAKLGRTFADVKPGELVAYTGSGGWLELAVRDGNARQELRLTTGMEIQLL